MYVRVVTFTSDPSRLEDGIRYATEEALGKVLEVPGSRGMSVAVDRAGSRVNVVAWWSDLDAVRASDPIVMPLREHAAEIMGGTASVEISEVVVQEMVETPQSGAWARVSMLDVSGGDMQDAIDLFRNTTLPAVMAMPGFIGGQLSVDETTGHAAAVTVWRDRESLDASEQRASRLRQEVVDKAHGVLIEVRRLEIVASRMAEA